MRTEGDKNTVEYFLLDDGMVAEINTVLLKYYQCLDRPVPAECDKVDSDGTCVGCEFFLNIEEEEFVYVLDKAFKQCLDMGFLRGGKKMADYDMEDVPREVWDEVYEKWSRALDIGWSPGMWTGCRVCTWMAGSLGIKGMAGDACAMCPLYEDEWCRSLPEDSLIHPDYNGGEWEDAITDDWETRVRTFLAFIKPYCSSDEKGDGENY